MTLLLPTRRRAPHPVECIGVRPGLGMKAHRLIDGATFGPATLKAVGQAFDEAWVQIASHFGNTPLEIESARMRLAEAILSIATEDSTDVAVLQAGALPALAMVYRSLRVRHTVKDME